jgi:hypothetical protein
MGGNNFGLNDSLKYYEFELDSLDASFSNSIGKCVLTNAKFNELFRCFSN